MSSFEQSGIGMLGALLIIYNDPLAIISVYIPNNLTILLEELSDIVFILAIFLFWLITFERMIYEQNKRESKSLTKWKVLFFSVFFVFEVLVYLFFTLKMRSDPTFSVRDNWMLLQFLLGG